MSEPSPGKPDNSGWFEIRIEGHLEPRWRAWFGAEQLERADDGTTILRGHMADQAQLHGLLQKIRDMGLPLVSLARLDDHPPAPLKTTQGLRLKDRSLPSPVAGSPRQP